MFSKRSRVISLVLCLIAVFAIAACGGGGDSTPPPPTYTVSGTITSLPASADGKDYFVSVTTDIDGEPTSYTQGTVSGTTIDYSIDDVPAGTYYVMAVVYVVGSGDDPVIGDYFGAYGWDGMDDPALMGANVTVSADTNGIDFTLTPCGCGL